MLITFAWNSYWFYCCQISNSIIIIPNTFFFFAFFFCLPTLWASFLLFPHLSINLLIYIRINSSIFILFYEFYSHYLHYFFWWKNCFRFGWLLCSFIIFPSSSKHLLYFLALYPRLALCFPSPSPGNTHFL